MKTAVVAGAGGFIGFHLVNTLKQQGYWVRGVDCKLPEFAPTSADEFLVLDLRQAENCQRAVQSVSTAPIDEVYQLAADMGGMGFIHAAECQIMSNSMRINLGMTEAAHAANVGRYFFASSACVYPDMNAGDSFVDEQHAYPAMPNNEYGWEKLYSERLALAYARNFGMQVRIARFQNCYGPLGTWRGGREKAPAALCRKVAEAAQDGIVEIWGNGTAMRSYTYVDDIVSGILTLMRSACSEPVNIGSAELVSVNELLSVIASVAGKDISIEHINGPVGVLARNHLFSNIEALGWQAQVSLREGIGKTYAWVAEQVEENR
jgi:GDP-D-mannose 3', 5'-epimerase